MASHLIPYRFVCVHICINMLQWDVDDSFLVASGIVGVLLIVSTVALAMSKKKIKARAHTARISTTGVATTSIYDIPVEPRPTETFFS